MKAMILAAGLGTRLKPLTDTLPKALVEVGGKPMLERVIDSLKSQGFDTIVVNVHHFADKVVDFLHKKDFGVQILISDESEELLDTGGGIVKAYPLLFNDSDSDKVLIHNVDILSNADYCQLRDYSILNSVLCISNRESSRKLIFNKDMELIGWHDLKSNLVRPESLSFELNKKLNEAESGLKEYAFSGIYSLTRKAIEEMKYLIGEGKFSVMEYFLHPNRKEKIEGFLKDINLIDIGKPATLSQAQTLYDK